MSSKNKREIVALSEKDHILARSSMYIGSVECTEEKVPIIENNKLILKNKVFSIGLHKLFGEIVDNAFDELKHIYQIKPNHKGKIEVKIDTKHNLVSVEDNGRGFYQGLEINEKTGLNNIVTAFSQLRAGSNFNNDDESANLIGTNGIGGSVVNVLSDVFNIETGDGKYKYSHTWSKFETVESNTEIGLFKPGTKVTFVPRFEIFNSLWDLELITTNMIFRNMLKNDDQLISNLIFNFYIDGELIDLNIPFMPAERLLLKSSNTMKCYVWHTTDNTTSASFVNGSLCTGIHQKMMQEIINDKIFDYDKAHYLYETFIIINLPPKNVKFGDQNKTKFVSTRGELDSIIQFDIPDKEIKSIKESKWYGLILDDIENSLKKEDMSKLKKARKNVKKISDKYFPSHKKENLFLVEGNCLDPNIKIKILNEFGFIKDVKLKDVNVGTKVLTHLGNFKNISSFFYTVKKQVRISIEGKDDIICSKNHRWYIYDNVNRKFKWKKTKKILPIYDQIVEFVSHEISMSDNYINNKYNCLNIKKIEYIDEYIDMVDIEVEDDNSFVLSNGIISHNSARGSILQKRNTETDAVYTLRGKLKNVKNISDLSSNQEIIDLINILDLNLEDKGDNIKFKRIIIASDKDFDGNHIASLILNFFNKWFPNIIKQGKLYKLVTPLVSTETKGKRKYFYSLAEFSKEDGPKPNIRYLKGLGSNDLKDWESIFENLTLERFSIDDDSDKMLLMAFGNNPNLRKKWLTLK